MCLLSPRHHYNSTPGTTHHLCRCQHLEGIDCPAPPPPPHRHMGNTRHHRCPRPNATVVFSCLATAIAQPLEQLMRWRGRWQRGNRSLLDVGIDADDELVAASHVVASALLLCDVHCRYCVPSHREHKARSSTWATHQQQHRWPHNQCRVTDNLV
jgi:hypothetical protein